MRLCLIGPTYPYRGGIAHYTTLLAQALRRRHQVLFISFSRQYPRWLFPGSDERDPSQEPLRAEAEYLLDGLNPLTWWRTLRRIGRWGAEAVVMPWWHPYWAPAWAALGHGLRRLPQRPRLLFLCHNVLPHERGRLDRLALRLALAGGAGYVVHSQAEAAYLRRQWPAARVVTVPHPTYAALGGAGVAALPASVPADRPLLLFAGIIRPYKGLAVLLDALPRVLEELPVHLLIMGECWEDETTYRQQIARLGLEEAVTFANAYVPDDLLAAAVRRAAVVVLPYRSATQSGMAQVAFGHGTPVITTAVGGLPEAVDDGVTGLVVPPEEPAALATAIKRYFAGNLGPVFRANIAAQAGRFSWERLVEAVEELAQPAGADAPQPPPSAR